MSDLTRRTALGALAIPLAAPALALPKGFQAPEWDIAEWINAEPFTLHSKLGQVVVIDFFQLWCPGCNAFSIPLTQRWEQDFAGEIADDRMSIVSIHTVFEGHRHQTIERLRSYVEDKGFGHPVGHDRHGFSDRLPNTMIMYGTRGTPEMAIIDPEGRIAFQQFGVFDADEKTQLIRDLMA